MSLYRTLLAAVAAIAIASPVFAEGTPDAAQNPADVATPATQATDNAQQVSSADQSQSDMAKELKINLNNASAKELAKVMGAPKAKATIAYRKKHGSFKSVDELAKVKGFSKMKADAMHKIQDQLTVE